MEVGDQTKIGLSTLHGFTEKGTIKIKGKIQGREAVVLINSRATTTSFTKK